jgi:CheY-like chemotaxis protein/anti-sigma regulatory factor (Ser/Thr protein kinase)
MHALGLFISELDQQSLPPSARGLVRHIAASADAMEKLLDSLLDISRLDAGVLQPKPRAFALQPLLVRLAVAHEAVAIERGLRLRLCCSGGWVHSDPVLLERILANLLGNAIRYTPGGTVLIACRHEADGMVRIEVRDNGIGISADKQEIIFQEFVQLDNAERARDKGLGLGLAIVRRLADLLGHRLTLRSAPGRGSVFAIALPRARESEVEATQEDERKPGDLGGVRIALLDDDPLACTGMASLLGSWGCDVLAAATADEALQRIDTGDWRPALVISDFRLHGMHNGLDFIHTVRERLAAPTLAAILISGDTGADMLALTSQSGVPMLHKPVRPARLRALIHRLLHAAQEDRPG